MAELTRQTVDVHTWFGLSYSSYLVVNRTLLQSMPEEWQHRFTAVMDDLGEAFAHLEHPHYNVRALKREQQLIAPPCDECEGLGVVVVDEDETDCRIDLACPERSDDGGVAEQ